MAANIENVGAKYPFAFRDAKGEFMFGGNNYKVNLPKDTPVAGDTARAATSGEVKDLRRETSALKEVVADLPLENRLLKKA